MYKIVGGAIQHYENQVPFKDGVYGIVNDILNKNYWQGDEVIREIEFIRAFKTILHYTENWIKEYAFRMLKR